MFWNIRRTLSYLQPNIFLGLIFSIVFHAIAVRKLVVDFMTTSFHFLKGYFMRKFISELSVNLIIGILLINITVFINFMWFGQVEYTYYFLFVIFIFMYYFRIKIDDENYKRKFIISHIFLIVVGVLFIFVFGGHFAWVLSILLLTIVMHISTIFKSHGEMQVSTTKIFIFLLIISCIYFFVINNDISVGGISSAFFSDSTSINDMNFVSTAIFENILVVSFICIVVLSIVNLSIFNVDSYASMLISCVDHGTLRGIIKKNNILLSGVCVFFAIILMIDLYLPLLYSSDLISSNSFGALFVSYLSPVLDRIVYLLNLIFSGDSFYMFEEITYDEFTPGESGYGGVYFLQEDIISLRIAQVALSIIIVGIIAGLSSYIIYLFYGMIFEYTKRKVSKNILDQENNTNEVSKNYKKTKIINKLKWKIHIQGVRRLFYKKVNKNIKKGINIKRYNSTDTIANKIYVEEDINELVKTYDEVRYGRGE